MARPSYKPRPVIWPVSRSPFARFPADAFVALVQQHADQGERVRIRRDGYAFYDLVENSGAYLVLQAGADAEPIGTFGNLAAAIMAGDQHVEAVRRGEFDAEDDLDPRGAA